MCGLPVVAGFENCGKWKSGAAEKKGGLPLPPFHRLFFPCQLFKPCSPPQFNKPQPAWLSELTFHMQITHITTDMSVCLTSINTAEVLLAACCFASVVFCISKPFTATHIHMLTCRYTLRFYQSAQNGPYKSCMSLPTERTGSGGTEQTQSDGVCIKE